MKKFYYPFVALVCLLAANTTVAQNRTEFLPGTVIFKVKPAYRGLCNDTLVNHDEIKKLFQNLDIIQLRKKFLNHRPPEKDKKSPVYTGEILTDLSLIYEFSYKSDIPLQKAIRQLMLSGIVEYAQPHYLPKPLFTPNEDSLKLANQYYLNNLRAFAGWDISKGDTNVVIGITDTGVDTAHADLNGNIKYNFSDPIDGIDNDNDGFTDNFRGWDLGDNDNDPTSSGSVWWQYHGVFVSGLAAGSTDNGIGIAGAGFNCKFLPVKISRNSDGAFISAYEGIVYAADHGCQIINCSWGAIETVGQFEQDVVNYATINKNALVIAAAGNNGDESVFYPASLKYVISVAGTDINDVKFAQFSPSVSISNYGINIDLCAPGANIYSTIFGNGYGWVNSGTSYSAPLTAGCAAIVKAHFPGYTALQVGEQLKVTTDIIDTIPGNTAFYGKLGSGRINLFRALTETSSPSIVMTAKTITDGNDDILSIGDTMWLKGTFTNYLAPSTGITVTLSSLSPNISILNGTVPLGPINTLDTVGNYSNPFYFTLDTATPYNKRIELKLSYSDSSGYSAFEYIALTVNPDFVNVTVNEVLTTLTSEGRIGFTDPVYPLQKEGLGFYFSGEQLLYEAGLMVGAISGPTTYVSDNVRDSLQNDKDFISVSAASKTLSSTIADFEGSCIINDAGAGSDKIGLTVINRTFAWTNQERAKYVIFKYELINNDSSKTLNGLYAGIYADWDIRDFSMNRASFDMGSRMGFIKSSEAGTPFGGVKLLSDGGFIHYAIDNVTGGAGGIDISYPNSFSTTKKYITLSTNRMEAGNSGTGNDVMHVVSTGPFTLLPLDTITVAFALLAGDNLLGLINSAANAQATYDSLFGKGNDTTSISDPRHQSLDIIIIPNPANLSIGILVKAFVKGDINLTIFNATGELVLATTLQPSVEKTKWLDISNLSDGLYYYQLISKAAVGSGKFIIAH